MKETKTCPVCKRYVSYLGTERNPLMCMCRTYDPEIIKRLEALETDVALLKAFYAKHKLGVE